MSDGLYVSPAIETADYHASLNKNSWFYVFDYQTKYGDYATVRIRTMRLNKIKKDPNVPGNVLLTSLSPSPSQKVKTLNVVSKVQVFNQDHLY